MQSLRVACNFG